jgi:hypothetical protein
MTMGTATNYESEVKAEIKKLDPGRITLIRQMFYQVADALPQLAEGLEFADLDLGGEGGPLIDEHLMVCEVIEAFRKLKIGKYL